MSNSLFKAAISFCVVIELSDFSNWMQTILGKLHISYCKIKTGSLVKFWTQAMLEITCNDRLGKKVRVKCNQDDTIGDLKKLIAAQTGTRPEKIVLKKWYTIYKDHVTVGDYEIHDGMNLELYYQWDRET